MPTITMNAFRKRPDGRLEWLACYQISEDLAFDRIDKEFPGTCGVLVWKFAYQHDRERLTRLHQAQNGGAAP